jgi:O-succinylbenzoate synthase
LAKGYRIKLKIKRGWDIDIVRAVRRHPDILLSVDANSAYTLADEDIYGDSMNWFAHD